jgi:cell division protein YceG involved in septum cleavage
MNSERMPRKLLVELISILVVNVLTLFVIQSSTALYFDHGYRVKDPKVVDVLKGNAIRALANFLMMESAAKDDRLREKVSTFSSKEAESILSEDKKKS